MSADADAVASYLIEDRATLTALVASAGARRGGRVLDIGCDDGRLVRSLRESGFDAAGLGESVQADENAGLFRGVLANSVPFAAGTADVAIVRDLAAYGADLDGLETLISTANLLSCLRPLGRVIFLRDDAVAPMNAAQTPRQRELAAHFDRFPCRTQILSRGEGFGRFLSPSFLLGRRPRRGGSVFTAQVPKQPVTRLQWHGYAREAAMNEMRRAA